MNHEDKVHKVEAGAIIRDYDSWLKIFSYNNNW